MQVSRRQRGPIASDATPAAPDGATSSPALMGRFDDIGKDIPF